MNVCTCCTTVLLYLQLGVLSKRERDLTLLGFVSLLKRCRYLFSPSTSSLLLSLLCHFTLACAPDQQQLGAAENVTSRIFGGSWGDQGPTFMA